MDNTARCADSASCRIKRRSLEFGICKSERYHDAPCLDVGGLQKTQLPRAQAQEKKKGLSNLKERRIRTRLRVAGDAGRVILMLVGCLVAGDAGRVILFQDTTQKKTPCQECRREERRRVHPRNDGAAKGKIMQGDRANPFAEFNWV
eukprot:g82924.t1